MYYREKGFILPSFIIIILAVCSKTNSFVEKHCCQTSCQYHCFGKEGKIDHQTLQQIIDSNSVCRASKSQVIDKIKLLQNKEL